MLRSSRCTRESAHSTIPALPAGAAVRLAVPSSGLPLSPDSYSERCSRAAVRHSSWPARAPYSPARSGLAPGQLVPGSPSDPPAPWHCGVSPDTATADRSWPTAPKSAHPADRLSSGSPRSSVRCGRAPRLLRVPTRSIPGSPTASAFRFPGRFDSAASRQTPLASLSESCSVCSSRTSPTSSNTQYQLERSPRSNPMVNFCCQIFLLSFAAVVLTFFIAGLLFICALSTSITWERTPHPVRRLAFSFENSPLMQCGVEVTLSARDFPIA